MAQPSPQTPPRLLSRLFRQIAHRPSLASGLGVAILALILIPGEMRLSTHLILAWDLGVLVYLTFISYVMTGATRLVLMKQAEALDMGANWVLGLSLLTSLSALSAMVIEMSLAKSDPAPDRLWHLSLAIGSVALAWGFVQTTFGLHYAHQYYRLLNPSATLEVPITSPNAPIRGGLEFPGSEAPDFWDFLHFSIIIGLTAQTADICITSKALRRLASLHSVIAFVFNAVILALAINLTASLF